MHLGFDSYVHRGPQPNFTLYHLWRCYSLIDKHGPIGRRTLSSLMNLGEGSVRTILGRMAKEGCIELTKRGATLTCRGREKFESLGVRTMDMGSAGLSTSKFNCTVLVRAMADRIEDGVEQRDEAVRAGAEGAITLVARENKITFPEDERYPEQKSIRPLQDVFGIKDGDVLIIGGADSYEAAEKGAVSAALSLLDSSDSCWGEGGRLFSRDSEEEDIMSIALMIHEIVGRLPVTMRSKNHYGVRCEDGKIIETNFTGPVLEETLKKGTIIRRTSRAGRYRGCPVLAVPLVRKHEVIAVVGVFDTTRGSYSEWQGRVRKQPRGPLSSPFRRRPRSRSACT